VKRALKEGYITTSKAAEMLDISLAEMYELISSWDLSLAKS
jgi:predicted HTH domain antitoxin